MKRERGGEGSDHRARVEAGDCANGECTGWTGDSSTRTKQREGEAGETKLSLPSLLEDKGERGQRRSVSGRS